MPSGPLKDRVIEVGRFRCRLSVALLLFVLATAGAVCGDRTRTEEALHSADEMGGSSAQSTQCAGRFSFRSAGLVEQSRWQSIFRTEVTTHSAGSGSAEDPWEARLQQLKEQEPRGVELGPGTQAAWYGAEPVDPNVRTLEAMRPVPGGTLVVKSESDTGREQFGEALTRNIVDSYLPGSRVGFCVGLGAIILGPSRNEEVRLVLASRELPELEVHFETRTVRAPDRTTYSDLDEERQLAAAEGVALIELRNRKRKAAGLVGRELWLRTAGLVRFTWHFPGAAGSAIEPAVTLVATAPEHLQADLQAVWEAILTSLTKIPPGAP
jgi:hypothetical protein